MKDVVCMRGLPGSGKSTLAKKLAEGQDAVILSADDFFCGGPIDLEFVYQAHVWCRAKLEWELRNGRSLAIVDNTNTKVSDLRCYIDVATEFGYDVTILEVECDIETSVARNIHGCPRETIEVMANRLHAGQLDPSWKVVKVSRQG